MRLTVTSIEGMQIKRKTQTRVEWLAMNTHQWNTQREEQFKNNQFTAADGIFALQSAEDWLEFINNHPQDPFIHASV